MSLTNDFKEYLTKLVELGNDPIYINEIEPAYAFYNHAPEYLKSNFVGLRKNAKDPPDFFLELKNNKLICLEVTSLANELIFKTNKFIKNLERIAEPIIEKYKTLLPTGSYMVTAFLGREKPILQYIDYDDFKNTISDIEVEETLEKDIPEWFKKYTENDKKNADKDCPIYNDNGAQIGKLTISKLCVAKETKISIWPQGVFQNRIWAREGFEDKLQEIVDKKENKYLNKYDGLWWLLVSDRGNRMNTTNLKFNLSTIKIKLRFFEKVFLIRIGDKVDELNVQFS